jgi:hypothetical protein
MSFTLFAMVGCPGLYDTKRRTLATEQYFDAPSDSTKLELEVAKAKDRRDILILEILMASMFGLLLFIYFRCERHFEKDSA